jgi:hypothetical protein
MGDTKFYLKLEKWNLIGKILKVNLFRIILLLIGCFLILIIICYLYLRSELLELELFHLIFSAVFALSFAVIECSFLMSSGYLINRSILYLNDYGTVIVIHNGRYRNTFIFKYPEVEIVNSIYSYSITNLFLDKLSGTLDCSLFIFHNKRSLTGKIYENKEMTSIECCSSKINNKLLQIINENISVGITSSPMAVPL